jgi:hypothetical protein
LPLIAGVPLSVFQLDAIAVAPEWLWCRIIPGKFVYTPKAGTQLPAGWNTLTATFTPADPNFKAVTVHQSIYVFPRGWH